MKGDSKYGFSDIFLCIPPTICGKNNETYLPLTFPCCPHLRNFTPTREKVEAAVDRYASSVELPPKFTPTSFAPIEIDFNASASANIRVEDSQHAHGHARAYERLREDLSPEYETLFRTVVAESDDGVCFLVGLRQVREGTYGMHERERG